MRALSAAVISSSARYMSMLRSMSSSESTSLFVLCFFFSGEETLLDSADDEDFDSREVREKSSVCCSFCSGIVASSRGWEFSARGCVEPDVL